MKLKIKSLPPLYSLIKLLLSVALYFSFSGCTIANEPETQVKYLSGKDFQNTETWEFYCTKGRNSGYWTTIEVPSHWEQQGFGNYDYGRNYMTYGKKYEFTDEEGLYKYKFSVPADWKNNEISIVFEGSMTDTEVKINGQLAGELHQGSFYRFKYNITKLLKFDGENLLEVRVSKQSANRSVNSAERYADYWIFGGIYRPVYLESKPKEHISWAAIDAKANGSFSIDIYGENISKTKDIRVSIFDQKGKEQAKLEGKFKQKKEKINLSTLVANAVPWNQEIPVMYSAKIELLQENKVIHSITEKFGFRTIEIRKEDGIYVNGTKVKMKGINRHAFWPESGRCLSDELNLLDVQLIKEMNMNAVRCSHYPPDKVFLEYCDSLGLFVINELAGWQNAYDTVVGEKLVKELVIRDVNHPSIIFWSNGNEGGHNHDLDDDYGKYDLSNRPVIHAHHKPGNDFNGIDCNHYEDYYSCKNLLEGPNIYMPTEFLHGQEDGGMAAGLYDFWELFWKEKLSGGGFLWTFVDEGIVRTDLDGYIDVNRVNAPDGVLGPHREKEGSFYAMREIFSPVKIEMEKLPDSFNGEIKLENRYHFINLNQCKFTWQLVNFPHPAERNHGYNQGEISKAESPDIAPVSAGTITLDLPKNWKDFDALRLKAYHPSGEEIFEWSWSVKSKDQIVNKIVKWDKGEVSFKENNDTYELSANDISIFISKKDGTLQELKNKFSRPLSFNNGPISVNNHNLKLLEVKHYKTDDGYCLDYKFDGDIKSLVWTMNPSGWVSLDYEYASKGEQPFSGVTFSYPESRIIGVKWLGNGPYRVWKNRMRGGNLDVHESFYNNTFTGFSPWTYPEFKGYYSEISWIEFNTVEGKFLVVANEDDLFVRLFDFYSLTGPENLPHLPNGDISFLDAIPPTGTKLWIRISSNTKKLGPNSELFKKDGLIKRKLYFYFGLPKK
jgi:hypothetical protein